MLFLYLCTPAVVGIMCRTHVFAAFDTSWFFGLAYATTVHRVNIADLALRYNSFSDIIITAVSFASTTVNRKINHRVFFTICLSYYYSQSKKSIAVSPFAIFIAVRFFRSPCPAIVFQSTFFFSPFSGGVYFLQSTSFSQFESLIYPRPLQQPTIFNCFAHFQTEKNPIPTHSITYSQQSNSFHRCVPPRE